MTDSVARKQVVREVAGDPAAEDRTEAGVRQPRRLPRNGHDGVGSAQHLARLRRIRTHTDGQLDGPQRDARQEQVPRR